VGRERYRVFGGHLEEVSRGEGGKKGRCRSLLQLGFGEDKGGGWVEGCLEEIRKKGGRETEKDAVGREEKGESDGCSRSREIEGREIVLP